MKQEIKERVEKIRRGEVPGGYKKTKVGIIPKGWDVKTLGEIVIKFVNGGTPSRRLENYWDGNIPWITGADILNQEVSVIRRYITNDAVKNSSTKVIEKGNLLLVSRTGVGKVAIAPFDIAISQDFTGIYVNNEELLTEYLYRYFNLHQSTLQSLNQGTSIQGITRDTLSAIQIPLPPLPKQQKIAEILSTWDKAIELKEKLIEEKKKLRIATVNDLLFGLKRYDDFIKSHKYTPTKYINIPEDWEFIKIGDIATEVSEKNGNHEELPVLSCTKHSGLVDSLRYFKKRVFSEDTSTYKQVKKNQFVYATNHIDEGSIGCQNIYENSLVSPMYTVFKTNSKVNNDFLFSLLKTRLYIFIYQVNMSASVDRRGSLRWNDFSKIRIPLPDIVEQNKIVEFIRSVDNEIELLKLELNQLKEQKRGLMQLLLTGIVRVEVD